jgi:hypothetical protein
MKKYLLLLTFVFFSCGSSKMLSAYTEEKNAIPPDFGKQGTILLIIKNNNIFNYNHFLKSAFEKNYFGEYKIIDYDQIESKEFENKEVYRYIFDFSRGTGYSSTYSNQSTGMSSSHVGNFKIFYVFDRFEEKKFQNKVEFSAYAKAMKAYITNLEVKRKKINNVNSN